MNYIKIYEQLIEKRKLNPVTKGYKENHHILPKSLGGDNSKENLVKLTGREHWIAHLLLHKIHRCPQTAHACHMMAMKCEERDIPQIKNSRMYEWARKQCIKHWSKNGKKRIGENNGSYGTMWICNLELKENKKIKKDEEIPDGWVKGRNGWNKRTKEQISLNARKNRFKRKYKNRVECDCCGKIKCLNIEICRCFPHLKNAFLNLGFDVKKLKTNEFYDEYYRIVDLLKSEYLENKLSMQNIADKYNLNSHQRVRKLLKSFNIKRRSLKEALKNYHNSQ
jgi:hypothetical protein